jgi:hypothetical protein
MLYEFVTTYRDAIIDRARAKLTARPWPSASLDELENGVPLFLTQLSEKLRSESTGAAPGQGCVFTIDLALAAEHMPVSPGIAE